MSNLALLEIIKMYSRIPMFFWRRKFLLMSSMIFTITALWFWSSVYSNDRTNDEEDRIMSIKELMFNGKPQEGMYQKLGFHDYNQESNNDLDPKGVKFVKPTAYVPVRKVKYFDNLDKILLDKNEKQRIQSLEMPTRDEIARRRAEHKEMGLAIERQSRYEHELKRMGVPIVAGIGPGGPPPPNQRLVHLDLKGAPPKISYLRRLLPILKTLGATGILMEYEDMFPYSGTISQLAAKNAYSEDELLEFLRTAFSLGLTVMPLVQTFGHLEFALKLKEFSHLREVEFSPQALCPSLNKSMVFIEEMLTQVVRMHTATKSKLAHHEDVEKLIPNLKEIHIGCDEVYHMGECPRCRERIRDELFLDHVYNVAALINKRWPHLKIVIWDDMLRKIPLETLQTFSIGKMVQPMIWVYTEDIYKFMQSATWDKYASVFPTAWTASAFKGAHGETLLVPSAKRHLENTLKWLQLIQGEGSRFSQGIQGIALTGWQRYDHFATLCELLPAALPSLAVCLATASKGYFDVNSRNNPILSSLTCPESSERHPWLELQKDPTLSSFTRCMFPGSPVFRFIQRLSSTSVEAKEFIDNVKLKRGWLSDYNIRHNFSSATRVDELMEEEPRLMTSVTNLAKNAVDAMFDVYDHWTIGEYIEQRIYPIMNELKNLEKAGDSLKMKKNWPQRPLPYLKQLEALGVTPSPIN